LPPGPPAQRFAVGNALSWAWNKFSKNAGALVVAMSVYAVVIVIVGALMFSIVVSAADTSDGGVGSPFVFIAGYLLLFAVGVFVQAAFVSGCLDIADGKALTVGSLFQPRNLSTAIPAALLVCVLTGVGNLFCFIPGLIVSFFTMFTVAFVIDRSLSPVQALKASIATVGSNVGGALLSFLAQLAAIAVGVLLCGVGLLVAAPVATLIQIYTYRRLAGGWLAPLG
jgi:uncharacterized membrane protein